MSYTLSDINNVLLKADKTLYRLGDAAYEDMFAEDSEILDHERDIIYLYTKALEYGVNFYVGTKFIDAIAEVLEFKCNIYGYGKLTPIYSDIVEYISVKSKNKYVLLVTPLVLDQGIIGPTDFSGDYIELALNYDYIKTRVREHYVHDQQTASATWVVLHNMNKYPAVNIVDTSNDIIMGEVRYNSLNQLTITFTAAISGKAYLN